jgi:hypothetical protein
MNWKYVLCLMGVILCFFKIMSTSNMYCLWRLGFMISLTNDVLKNIGFKIAREVSRIVEIKQHTTGKRQTPSAKVYWCSTDLADHLRQQPW